MIIIRKTKAKGSKAKQEVKKIRKREKIKEMLVRKMNLHQHQTKRRA